MMKNIFFDIETYTFKENDTNYYNGKIILIGYKMNNDDIILLKEWDSSENDIINNFISFLKKEGNSVLIGYNIFNFDIPYLIKRLDKKVTFVELFNNKVRVVDLRQIYIYMNNFSFYGRAEDASNRFNLPCFKDKNNITGQQIRESYDIHTKESLAKIEKHNKEDIYFNKYLYDYFKNE